MGSAIPPIGSSQLAISCERVRSEVARFEHYPES